MPVKFLNPISFTVQIWKQLLLENNQDDPTVLIHAQHHSRELYPSRYPECASLFHQNAIWRSQESQIVKLSSKSESTGHQNGSWPTKVVLDPFHHQEWWCQCHGSSQHLRRDATIFKFSCEGQGSWQTPAKPKLPILNLRKLASVWVCHYISIKLERQRRSVFSVQVYN